jgi:hypothetical protein
MNKKQVMTIGVLALLAIITSGCIKPAKLTFAGRVWKVMAGTEMLAEGVMDNFSEKNAWVDSEGTLHYAIRQEEGQWKCAVLMLDDSLGYGTYVFEYHGRMDLLDEQAVNEIQIFSGMSCESESYYPPVFTMNDWDRDAIDNVKMLSYNTYIEDQFDDSDDDYSQPFILNLTDEESDFTTYVTWTKGKVTARTYLGACTENGPPPPTALFHKWSYCGPGVQKPAGQKVHLGLWLKGNNPPANGKEVEVQMTDFRFLPEEPDWGAFEATTNMTLYPIAGSLYPAVTAQLNGQTVSLDQYGSLYREVLLSVGLNRFEAQGFDDQGDPTGDPLFWEVTFDQALNTAGRNLVYLVGDSTKVVDADAGAILGVLDGVRFAAFTHDGSYAVDFSGQVYDTATHQPAGDALPFPADNVSTPLFSGDDKYCYVGYEKYDFASRQLLSDNFPIFVDAGPFVGTGPYGQSTVSSELMPTVVLPNGEMRQVTNGKIATVDLATDQIISDVTISPSIYPVQYLDLTGTLGFRTYYSAVEGYLTAYDLSSPESVQAVDTENGLGDYLYQVVFSPDNQSAFVGAGGNPYFNGGGVYIYDLASNKIVGTRYPQYGTSCLAAGGDKVYVRSACVYNGDRFNGDWGHRGIDVLAYDQSAETLHFERTFFLGASDEPIDELVLIKPAN